MVCTENASKEHAHIHLKSILLQKCKHTMNILASILLLFSVTYTLNSTHNFKLLNINYVVKKKKYKYFIDKCNT